MPHFEAGQNTILLNSTLIRPRLINSCFLVDLFQEAITQYAMDLERRSNDLLGNLFVLKGHLAFFIRVSSVAWFKRRRGAAAGSAVPAGGIPG